MELFSSDPDSPRPGDPARAPESAPLADRMRPETLDELVGQDELIGPGRPLRAAIERDQLRSMILWGPPGSGKTTLARLVARLTRAQFIQFSAVLSGIKEIKDVMRAAGVPTARTLARATVRIRCMGSSP